MKPLFPKSRWHEMKFRCLPWIILLPVLSDGAQETIPVPGSGADGPTASADPFAFHLGDSSRYQQVYSATAFSSIDQQGAWITRLFWVSDLVFGRGDFGASLPSVEISLSVTPRGPDQLSSTFAENLVLPSAIVYGRGSLLLDSGGRGSIVDMTFQTPFFYSPAEGNLLLEIKNYEPTCCIGVPQLSVGPLDAYNVLGDPISRVYAYDVNAATGIADTLGLTTYFVVTPIPEPSTLTLVALALGTCGWRWLRMKRSSIKR